MLEEMFYKIQAPLRFLSCGCLDFLNIESSALANSFFKFFDSLVSVTNPILVKKDIIEENHEIDEIPKTKCWSCEAIDQLQNPFFCSKCGCIQEIEKNIDYFQLYEVYNYNVNHEHLAKKARELQSQINPNKFRDKSVREYNLALQWNDFLKSAYYTLCSSLRRGKYILLKRKIHLPTNYKCLDENFQNNISFVIKMMHLYDKKVELRDLQLSIRNQITYQIKLTGCSLESQDFETAAKDLLKLQYLYDVNNKINIKINNVRKDE